MPVTSSTRTIAIIGDPIGHSLTPLIQNRALQEAGVDIVNVAYQVTAACLENAVSGARALGFLGLMVTIPHKEAVLPFCDELDTSARTVGAANLLQFRNGRTIGFSTDGWAALSSLHEAGVAVAGKRVTIIGSGGAARSLALSLVAEKPGAINLLNRTVTRAEVLAAEISAAGVPATAASCDEDSLQRVLGESELLINATSLGMSTSIRSTPVPARLLHADMAVYDIVYNPLETRLLREARAAGATAVDGLGMLIYTNVRAAQVCAGVELSAAVMRTEALRFLRS